MGKLNDYEHCWYADTRENFLSLFNDNPDTPAKFLVAFADEQVGLILLCSPEVTWVLEDSRCPSEVGIGKPWVSRSRKSAVDNTRWKRQPIRPQSGLWIWEGSLRTSGGTYEHPEEYDVYFSDGIWRDLTAKEFFAFRKHDYLEILRLWGCTS